MQTTGLHLAFLSEYPSSHTNWNVIERFIGQVNYALYCWRKCSIFSAEKQGQCSHSFNLQGILHLFPPFSTQYWNVQLHVLCFNCSQFTAQSILSTWDVLCILCYFYSWMDLPRVLLPPFVFVQYFFYILFSNIFNKLHTHCFAVGIEVIFHFNKIKEKLLFLVVGLNYIYSLTWMN